MANRKASAILDNGAGRRLFVKIFKEDVKLHYAKAQQLHVAGLKSKYFLSPRPLHMFKEHGTIVWEYLPGLVDLRAFLLKPKGTKEGGRQLHRKLLRMCGQALATIHSCLDLDGTTRPHAFPTPSIDGWPNLHRRVATMIEHSAVRYLHGDFGCANIFLRSSVDAAPQLIVLDACPNFFLYNNAPINVFGTIFLDLALFVASLNSKPSFYFHFRNDIQFFAEEFVRGYEEVALCSIDRATVFACAGESLMKYREYQKRRAPRGSLDTWWEWQFRGWSARKLFGTALHEMGN